MRMSIIVARSNNNIIGLNNKIPWHSAEDFKWFKERTMGNAVIMGRNTFNEIGKPLPGRMNIVITSNKDKALAEDPLLTKYQKVDNINPANKRRHRQLYVVETVEKAKLLCNLYGYDNLFVIGGIRLYNETIDQVDSLYITEVALEVKHNDDDVVHRFSYEPKERDWRILNKIHKGELTFYHYSRKKHF